MKRIITLSITLLFLLVSLLGCTSVDTKEKISDYNWKMESVSDLEGDPLESEMTIVFNDDNSFVLTDKSNNEEWKGEYATEKVDSSYKLDLLFEDTEETITGVYGIREYEDKITVPSITFQFEDKILSFIANE